MSRANKTIADRNQRILLELVSMPGNDVCADCKSRAPRWASHNLGIFICVHCASIHRKIGTHVTKVKSLTLDSWTKEQAENMKNIGNVKANQHWNPDERANPIPANMEESERDSELEQYIRAKYEHKRFVKKAAIEASQPGPPYSKLQVPKRSHTAPISHSSSHHSARSSSATLPSQPESSVPPLPLDPRTSSAVSPPSIRTANVNVATSTFGQVNAFATAPMRTSSSNSIPQITDIRTASQKSSLTQSTFDDLVSLQGPSSSASLPLQYQYSSSFQTLASASSPVQTGTVFGQQTFASPQMSSSVGFSGAAQSGLVGNPFYASQQFASTPFLSQSTGVVQPQAFTSGVGIPMTTLSQPQPRPQPPAANPFAQQQSGMINHPQMPYAPMQSASPYFLQPSPSPQIPQTESGAMPSTTMYSNQVQQAQQVFQSMAGNGSPFNNQGWR